MFLNDVIRDVIPDISIHLYIYIIFNIYIYNIYKRNDVKVDVSIDVIFQPPLYMKKHN